MNKTRISLIVLAVVMFAAGGWYVAQSLAPHKHELAKATDAQGKTYYTCPMHPQVRQDAPGSCPICGMKLVERVEGPGPGSSHAGGAGEAGPGRRILYWYDPMKPEVHFDKPGKSPFMDMELQPKYADGGATDAGSAVQIDPRVAQRLGVRTAPVERGTLAQEIAAVGAVDVDERRIFAVESRAAGWVEQLDVRAVGDPVKRGQRVAGVYSPELLSAQEELVLAAQGGDAGLVAAARQRLLLLGASEAQAGEVLRARKSQRLTRIVAPSAGVVTDLNVRQGQQVSPGTPLMTIADLSRVWITVEIPEALAGAVRTGNRAQARLSAVPGQVFDGRVDYLYPRLDAATRTLRARVVFDNPRGALRPGMFADVALAGGAARETLQVPSQAVIRTGERTVVLVAEGEGRFLPVAVEVGAEHGDRVAILSGLEEGQQVVVSGQFLIDSEASLQGAYDRLGGDGVQPPAGSMRNLGGGASPGAYEAPSPADGGSR